MATSLKKYQLGILLSLLSVVHTEVFADQNDAVNELADTAVVVSDLQDMQDSISEADAVSRKVVSSPVDKKEEDQQEDELDSDGHIFGYENGYLHGSLALHGEWTDNLYNYDRDKRDNFLTRISPSVWLTWPKRYRRPLQIAPDNTAPGGVQYSLSEYEVFNKYQFYLAGKMDIMNYSENSDLNHIEHGLEALFQYQPKFRLTFHLLDKYTHSQDIFNITEATLPDNSRVYDSNIFSAGVDWQFSDKLSLRMEYRNFFLVYEEDLSNFLDRIDNGFYSAFYYDYSPKTNLFLEYQYLLASYDEKIMPDNGNTYLNAGVNWQATVKTSFQIKAGYQQVNYDYEDIEYDEAENPDDLINDNDAGFNFEVQAIWKATPKSNLLLNTKYSIEQTDSQSALNKAVFVARIAFDHRFTKRIRADINLVYEDSDYAMFNGGPRLDKRWYLKPELRFAVNKWLAAGIYYSFDKKDSNFDQLDYTTNTFGINLRSSF